MIYRTFINPTARKGDKAQGILAHRFPQATLLPYRVDEPADALVVCGGDGTLRRALNLELPKDLYYLPLGTVNDKGHLSSGKLVVGDTNLGRFSYVFATGSLTDIGYNTPRSAKRRFGRLAYLGKALDSFRLQHIPAKIRAGFLVDEGEYTLVMLLVGKRCFGFNFVKDNVPDGAYLLTVRTPSHSGLIGLWQLFWRYARVFWVGIKPDYHRHGIDLVRADRASIELSHPVHWCVDGDRLTTEKVDFVRTPLDVTMHVLRKRKKPITSPTV